MKDPLIQHGADYKALRRQGLSKDNAEQIVTAANNESSGNLDMNYEHLSYDNLKELARLRKIKGIEDMSKEDVIKALRRQEQS